MTKKLNNKYQWGHDKPYNDFSSYFKKQFNERVQKIAVDAGFTCPNRDGAKGRGGCTYCNNDTFNPFYCSPQKSITEQLKEGIAFFAKKYKTQKYLAYFQAYSNTYADLPILKTYYSEALTVDGIIGLVIATRPDCVDEELLDYLQSLAKNYYIILEYGIESCNNETLKLHQLQIIKGTKMAKQYAENPEMFKLFTADEYIDFVVHFAERLNPKVIIERFISESPADMLIAPKWGGLKNFEIVAKISKKFNNSDSWQGKFYK